MLSSVPDKLPAATLCQSGQTWNWDEVEFTMMNPITIGSSRANNDSCVLQIRSQYGIVLLPADIEARAERQLIARWDARLRSDVLVAPHHGSKTSSTPEFIDAVAPRFVLFPVGYRNRHRHPNVTAACTGAIRLRRERWSFLWVRKALNIRRIGNGIADIGTPITRHENRITPVFEVFIPSVTLAARSRVARSPRALGASRTFLSFSAE